jgi:two-component SAPR family response regulator
MVVDDCKDVNYAFKIVLSESDQRVEVHSFNDPLVDLQEFRPGLYDLIIIDILMSRMNGFELYDKVRELDSNVKMCAYGVLIHFCKCKDSIPKRNSMFWLYSRNRSLIDIKSMERLPQ